MPACMQSYLFMFVDFMVHKILSISFQHDCELRLSTNPTKYPTRKQRKLWIKGKLHGITSDIGGKPFKRNGIIKEINKNIYKIVFVPKCEGTNLQFPFPPSAIVLLADRHDLPHLQGQLLGPGCSVSGNHRGNFRFGEGGCWGSWGIVAWSCRRLAL